MTRVEELTLDLADGVLPEEEERELEQLVAGDDAALWSHLRLLEIEAVLRGGRLGMDLTVKTMERLRAALEAEVESGVMEAIRRTEGSRTRPASAEPDIRGDHGRLGRRRGAGIRLLVAASLAAVLGFGFWALRERPDTAVASVERDAPGVVILRGDRQIPAARGAGIFPGDRLEVRGGDKAEIELASGIGIELGTHGRIVFAEGSVEHQARIVLERGALRTRKERTPRGGSLVVSTPHAEVESHGSPLTVVAREAETRVEAREGPARVRRLRDGAAVDVPLGYFVVADGHSLEPLVPRSIHHPEIDLHRMEGARKEHR